MASVVIVPPPRLGGVYEDNRIWARQYVAADRRNRALIALAHSTASAVLDATRAATAGAGRDGQIIYAVGHGGAGAGAQAGQADFAPRRAFRVSQFLAFYNDQTGSWQGPSIPTIEQELRQIRAIRSRSVRRREERAWCGRYIADGCATARGQVLDLRNLQPHYLELGRIFRRSPVQRIYLLTCNVGNASGFLNELATDLGVPVVAYTERVMSRWEVRRGQPRHVWMFLEGDQPGHGSNNDRADTELLPGVDAAKVRTGRVITRRP
jgi:hypothetical protein